jgi:hypothetical protein
VRKKEIDAVKKKAKEKETRKSRQQARRAREREDFFCGTGVVEFEEGLVLS